MTDRPRFRVELVAEPGDDREPAYRLKLFLKRALRSFKLRAVSVERSPARPAAERVGGLRGTP